MRGGRGVQRPAIRHAFTPTTIPVTLTAVQAVAPTLMKAQSRSVFVGLSEAAAVSANTSRKMSATVSENSKIMKLTPRNLSALVTEHASILVGTGSAHVLTTFVTESASIVGDIANRVRTLVASPVITVGSISSIKALKSTLSPVVSVVVGVTKQSPALLQAVPVVERVASLSKPRSVSLQSLATTISAVARGIPNKSFLIIVNIIAVTNRGYQGPPKALQLYDLSDKYKPPNKLDGVNVSYMNGIFGVGVEFDIYQAYEAAGGPFWVCDNGIKEVLDKHPAVVRLQ